MKADLMKKYIWIVMTNPVEGQEQEYHDWYDRIHLADILKCPGVVSAQRFAVTTRQRMPPPYPYQYMARFEIKTDDLDAFIRLINERTGSSEMPISPALGASRLGLFFEAITEERRRDHQATSEMEPGR